MRASSDESDSDIETPFSAKINQQQQQHSKTAARQRSSYHPATREDHQQFNRTEQQYNRAERQYNRTEQLYSNSKAARVEQLQRRSSADDERPISPMKNHRQVYAGTERRDEGQRRGYGKISLLASPRSYKAMDDEATVRLVSLFANPRPYKVKDQTHQTINSI